MKQILKSGAALVRIVVRGLWSLLGPGPGWSGLKRWLLQIATLGMLTGAGGFLFAASGLAPIKASSGHWSITEWFLNFSMSRSVSTHSLGIKVPRLDDRNMVLKGATHYETACFPCHGSPALPHPRIAQAMTPHPPYLPPAIHEWEPEELFYIVKHGVKFTGMPAWPAQQRDDEVWAMVAFLQKFPALTDQEYRRLVSSGEFVSKEDAPIHALTGPEAIPRPISAIKNSCQRCHGMDGQGRGSSAFPKLAGQQREYLEASLEAYAQGRRPSGIMEPVAAGLSRDEIREIARYYASLTIAEISAPESVAPKTTVPEPTANPQASDTAVSRGAIIAREGVPNQRIPICAECHGPGDNPRKSIYPTLAGQYADYVVQQLELFASDHRGGSEYAHLMHPIADRLTPQQMRDVAQYYESLAAPVVPPTP